MLLFSHRVLRHGTDIFAGLYSSALRLSGDISRSHDKFEHALVLESAEEKSTNRGSAGTIAGEEHLEVAGVKSYCGECEGDAIGVVTGVIPVHIGIDGTGVLGIEGTGVGICIATGIAMNACVCCCFCCSN